MPFWLSDYKRLECTLLCLSSRLLPTKREKSLTRSKLQRKLKFCSTSCTTEEKRREKERKHPWRFKGKTSTRAFLTQLTHKLSKKVALQPRANYASCAERCCELKARSAALCVASRPRTWSYGWRKKSRALRQPAQQQLAQTNFAHLFAP